MMTEQFKAMKLKEIFAKEECKDTVYTMAPPLGKFPLVLVANKTAGEIFELAVTAKLIPVETRDALVEKLQQQLGLIE